MNTKNMKGALSRSLEAETEAIQKKKVTEQTPDRFNKADAFFGEDTQPQEKEEPKRQVRDSFTFPVEDHELIQKIVTRFLQQGVSVNKSETLRASLQLLYSLSDQELVDAFSGIKKIKTGRPPKRGA